MHNRNQVKIKHTNQIASDFDSIEMFLTEFYFRL